MECCLKLSVSEAKLQRRNSDLSPSAWVVHPPQVAAQHSWGQNRAGFTLQISHRAVSAL